MEKGTYGYINYKKKKQLIISLTILISAIIIFLLGYFLNKKSNANIFSIIAVLMILPFGRNFVTYIVMFPFHSVDKTKDKEVRGILSGKVQVFSDLVISSNEKVMGLSFLILSENIVYGLIGREKEDAMYIENYLKRGLKDRKLNYKVIVFTSYDKFLKQIKTIKKDEKVTEKSKTAKEFLLSLCI